ncbi:MAG: cytochrome c3 family protein [Planctomycetaceae bacterium]|nr:cytochrome c3 family protein [Planctomycetaceae bacterium]
MNCEQCHTTAMWTGATFTHSTFPLTGAHQSLDCNRCHSSGVYSGLSQQCQTCHLDDYNKTTNPNHVAAGFPLMCETCHNTTRWSGATFTHTFNINSGPHSQFSCSECHQNAGSFQMASCTDCHEHRQSEADSKHRDVSGYQWNSASCISCHPTGRH